MIIRNARIVLKDEIVDGSLFVRDGRIGEIVPGNSSALGTIDFEGDLLLPGLVELHTDNLERNLMPRPKVHWPTLPAILAHDAQVIAAGITTVFDALAVGDVDHESVRAEGIAEPVRLIGHAADQGLLRAEHLLHLRCEIAVPEVLDLLRPFLAEQRLRLVSLMDHTPGQRQFRDEQKLRDYYRGKSGRLSDAELDVMFEKRREHARLHAAPNYRDLVEMARARGIPLASHDDTTADHVAQSIEDGVAIAEFPTTIAAAQALHAGGVRVLMGAPNLVRGGSHSGNVATAELARAGVLDVLSSDYVPASLLMAALHLPDAVPAISLPAAIRTVTKTAAEAVGLGDRGEIAAGKRADLVRVHVAKGIPVVRTVWRAGRRVA